MKRSSNLISALLGFLLLVALGVGLAVVLRGMPAATSGPGPSPLATAVTLQSPLNTPMPVSTPSPVATATPLVIPPPPDWPTDQPWPPTPATPVVPPTAIPQPFPTPDFQLTPQGARPSALQSIWYLHFPDSASSPQLRSVLVDQSGQRWDENTKSIDLGLRPQYPGPSLRSLYPSPDGLLAIAERAYGDSIQAIVIDLVNGTSSPVFADNSNSFLTWYPDGQRLLVNSDKGFQIFDPISQKYQNTNFNLPKADSGYSLVSAVAYSPNGSLLADASVYIPTVSKPAAEVEIGLSESDSGVRTVLAHLTGDHVIPHSLRWSPDGKKLIVVLEVGLNDLDLSNDDIQLWIVDRLTGKSELLAQGLSASPAVWSPDGRFVGFLKNAQIHLLDPITKSMQQIVHPSGQPIQQFTWSPDGTQVAFAVSLNDYGEIWKSSLRGTLQHPVAGPTTHDGVFMWLP